MIGTGRDIGQIHVAAVIVRLQRGDRLDLGRHADRADERLVGQRDLVAPAHAVPVDMQLLDALGQRRIEHRRGTGPDQPAELRDDAGRSGRLLAARLDVVDIDGEAIALLGALDRDRSALRVQVGKVQLRRGAVALAGEHAPESVFGLDDDDPAGIDRQGRLRIGAVDVVEFPLLLDRQAMASRRPRPWRRPASP